MTEGPSTPPMGDPQGGNPAAGGPQGGPPPSQPPPPGGGPGGPPPPAPQAPAAGTGIGQPADLMTRFLARLIDSVVLWVVTAVIVTTVLIGAVFSAGSGGMFGGGFNLPGLIGSIVTAAIFVGYFAFLESSKGQTLGKMAMKIQVQGPDGQNPSMEQAIKRNAWMALSIVPVIGGLLQLAAAIYIMVTINNNTTTRQGWHDGFADGTRVIKIG